MMMTVEEKHDLFKGMTIMATINVALAAVGFMGMAMRPPSILGLLIFLYPLVALLSGGLVLSIVRMMRQPREVYRGVGITMCITFVISCAWWVYTASHLQF